MNAEHFYLTRLLALRSGMSEDDATLLAWSNYLTDKMTSWDQGMVTQVYSPNAMDGLVQRLILSSFHFFPSDEEGDPWVAKADDVLLRGLWGYGRLKTIGKGIALHVYQDTFTHAGFRAVEDERNGPGDYSFPPPIGHARFYGWPDEPWRKWAHLNGQVIDNPSVFLAASKATWGLLSDEEFPTDMEEALLEAFQMDDDERRHFRLSHMTDNNVSWDEAHDRLWPIHHDSWISAAKVHLAWSLSYLPLGEP